MGFVKITRPETGELIYDSRRDDLPEHDLEYLNSWDELVKKQAEPKLKSTLQELRDVATEKCLEERFLEALDRLKLNKKPSAVTLGQLVETTSQYERQGQHNV
jgi:hypothetical protein